ncbi:MAG: hypothetical protein WCE75_06250 [Terracidiphilus sp.]
MKKIATALVTLASAVMLGWSLYCLLVAPAEPPFDWRQHMTAAEHDALVDRIDHLYRVAAYAITWAIQLGYLGFLSWNCRAQQTKGSRVGTGSR